MVIHLDEVALVDHAGQLVLVLLDEGELVLSQHVLVLDAGLAQAWEACTRYHS